MSKKKAYGPAPEDIQATLIKFPTQGAQKKQLPSTQSAEEWHARFQAASLKAAEILEAYAALDRGDFCDELEKEVLDPVVVSCLIELATAKGRALTAAAGGNAKAQKDRVARGVVHAAWLQNLASYSPKSKAAFSEWWSTKLELDLQYKVEPLTISKNWLPPAPQKS